MTYLLICLTAFLVSGLTLFSGFGLGTVLMPAFAVFFPLPVAIAATAISTVIVDIVRLAAYGTALMGRCATTTRRQCDATPSSAGGRQTSSLHACTVRRVDAGRLPTNSASMSAVPE